MQNFFSDSDQVHSDNEDNNKTSDIINDISCSALFYITKDGDIMFETAWAEDDNQKNMDYLVTLLYGVRYSKIIEQGLLSAISSYQKEKNENMVKDLEYIFDKFSELNTMFDSVKSQISSSKPLISPIECK